MSILFKYEKDAAYRLAKCLEFYASDANIVKFGLFWEFFVEKLILFTSNFKGILQKTPQDYVKSITILNASKNLRRQKFKCIDPCKQIGHENHEKWQNFSKY